MSPCRVTRLQHLGVAMLPAVVGMFLLCLFAAAGGTWASPVNASISFSSITATVGASPAALGVDPATGYVYVAHSGEASVSVLHGTSVITTLLVGNSPRSIGVNPVTGYTYVGNYLSNDVTILHGTSVVTTVSGVIAYPQKITVNPTTGYVYVGGSYFNTVWILTNTQVVTGVPLGGFGASNHPYDIEANVLNGNVYVSTFNITHQLKVLNGTQVIATIPVSSAGQIGVNPVADYVYLTNANNGTQPGSLTVISGTAVVGEIPVGTNPHAIAVDPLRGYVYVVNYSDGTVTVITGTSVLTTATVSAAPYAIGVEPNTGFAFVTDEISATVYVLQGPEIMGTATSEYGAHSIASHPSTSITYIANEYSNSVSMIIRAGPNHVYLPLVMSN